MWWDIHSYREHLSICSCCCYARNPVIFSDDEQRVSNHLRKLSKIIVFRFHEIILRRRARTPRSTVIIIIIIIIITLPKTKIAPENRPGSRKESIEFQASIFRCKLAVSFREGILVAHKCTSWLVSILHYPRVIILPTHGTISQGNHSKWSYIFIGNDPPQKKW